MSLVIYNTLSKQKEKFIPLVEGEVKMYVCGPTVYDFLHIGNFRGAIFFNLLRNWLELSGYKVTYVYNYTDVDDKIIKRANAENRDSSEVTEEFIAEFEKDFNHLGLTPHTHNPRVTDYMPQIVETVEKLIANGKAYVVEGEVFYEIDQFSAYGQLSGKRLEDLEAGQRVEVDQRKRNPFDFVLWKPSKEGEPSWDSPWGKGRPGWHIECSAMIRSILGDSIDIHGGGIDLIFPHHENEIAQGEGCCDKKYCNYWMHNNFILMKDEKMSKSLGNVITARNFMDKYHPEILKYLMLSAHYRTLLNISDDKIHMCISGLARVYHALEIAVEVKGRDLASGRLDKKFKELLERSDKKITKAMNDDLNTGEVIAAIFEVVRAFNALNYVKNKKDPNGPITAQAFLEWVGKYGKMLALFELEPTQLLIELDDILLNEKELKREDVDDLVAKRQQARVDKNWEMSDQYRDQLTAWGIEVLDGADGVTWTVKKS